MEWPHNGRVLGVPWAQHTKPTQAGELFTGFLENHEGILRENGTNVGREAWKSAPSQPHGGQTYSEYDHFRKIILKQAWGRLQWNKGKCRQSVTVLQCLANTLGGRKPPVWEARLSKISLRDQLDSLHALKLLLMLLHHKCGLHDLGSYLQPLNGLFTAWSKHDPFVKTGDRSSSAGQGWEGGGWAHSYQGIGHCGEIVMALTHICHSTVIIIVLKVGHVYEVQEGRKKRGKDTRQEEGKDREKKCSWEQQHGAMRRKAEIQHRDTHIIK